MHKSTHWEHYVHALADCLAKPEFCDAHGVRLSLDQGMSVWFDMAHDLRRRKACLFFAGNGASASMCSHFAADLGKNARMRTMVFTDPALLTAVGNDLGFDQVFAEPLTRMGAREDMLLTISSSGNSPNILAAIAAARQVGMGVCTLSGMSPQNASRSLGDLNIYISAQSYALVESAHGALLHYWTSLLSESA